jgi:hypothetical protein
MFSTANITAVSSAIWARPASKPLAYSRCHRNGGCVTTVSAPTASATSRARASFAQGSVVHTRCVISKQGAWIEVIGIS